MLGGLTVPQVSSHHPLPTGLLPHPAGAGVHVPVTPTHRPVPLRTNTALRTDLSPVTTGTVVRQGHSPQTVLHHQVAEVDVGPAVSPAHHVRVLVTVVLTAGQARVVLTNIPVNLNITLLLSGSGSSLLCYCVVLLVLLIV